jgi:hypothetical protein
MTSAGRKNEGQNEAEKGQIEAEKSRKRGRFGAFWSNRSREIPGKRPFLHISAAFSDADVQWISDPCAESPLVSLSTRPAAETWSPSSSVISFTPCAGSFVGVIGGHQVE